MAFLLSLFAVLLLVGGVASALWLRVVGGGLDPLPAPRLRERAPRVSIVLPARNEAHNLGPCLSSLQRLDYPDLEILVVAGGEDETLALAAALAQGDPRVHVLPEPGLPPGWVGKNWASHVGAQAATGEWLLFTDADTVHGRESLARAMTTALDHDLGFLTGLTEQVLGSPVERALLPSVFLVIATAVKGVSSRSLQDPRHAVGNGQYMLFHHDAYARVGGHKAVRARIAEDLALARQAAAAGLASRFVDLTEEVKVRMYRTLDEMWRGWRKNVSEGFVVTPPLATAMTVLVGAQGTLALPLALAAVAAGAPGATLIALLAYATLSWRLAFEAPGNRSAGWRAYALVHPVGFWFFDLVLAASLMDRLTGRGHVWKGRRYFP